MKLTKTLSKNSMFSNNSALSTNQYFAILFSQAVQSACFVINTEHTCMTRSSSTRRFKQAPMSRMPSAVVFTRMSYGSTE